LRAAVALALAVAAAVVHGQPAAPGRGIAKASAQQRVVQWRTDSANSNVGRVVVELTGLTPSELQPLRQANWTVEHWQRLFPVYVEPGTAGSSSEEVPMAGDYRVRTGAIQFEPAFPLEPGLRYRAVFYASRLPGAAEATAPTVAASYGLPPPASHSPTVVACVYPTADQVPENLLKFYLHFSAPMSRGHIYDFIHLRDATGRNVELPFLEIDEELWDPAMTRLTLFLDPGRIKRGVRPLEEIGPALQAGKRYTLFISREWQDATGRPLARDFEKVFVVTAADREPLDPSRWRIEPPRSGTSSALAIGFPKPLDHALALRMIQVADVSGALVAGTAELTNAECRWSFRPAQPWRLGRYDLLVPITLEDLAGNNVGKPFDVDLFESVTGRVTNAVEKITFVVR
jgi:hypothetical protein